MHLTVNVCRSELTTMLDHRMLNLLFSSPLDVDGKARTGKWVLFILPLVTVLREGLVSFPKSESKRLISPSL